MKKSINKDLKHIKYPSKVFPLSTLVITAALVGSMFFASPSFSQNQQKKPVGQKPTTSKQVSTTKNSTKTDTVKKDTINYEAVKKLPIWKVEEIYGKEKTLEILLKCNLEEINKLRAEKWAQPLSLDTSLIKASQLYAEEMAETENFGHTWKDWSRSRHRAMAAGYPNDLVGENILSSGDSIDDAIDMWKTSYGHYQTLMDPRTSRFWAGYCRGYRVNMFGAIK